MEKPTMKELKHTIDLEEFLINDLKSDEEIKLFLNANLKDYLEDGDFNSFYRALEPNRILHKKPEYHAHIFIAFSKAKKNQNFQPLQKSFRN